MPDKRCAKAMVQDLSRALGCDSATGKISVRFLPDWRRTRKLFCWSFESIRSPHAQRPPPGGLVQTELWEMAVQLRYVRQTIVTCCQLLPEWGIIRVSKEPLRVSKGHWKVTKWQLTWNLAVFLRFSSRAERQSHRLCRRTIAVDSRAPAADRGDRSNLIGSASTIIPARSLL